MGAITILILHLCLVIRLGFTGSSEDLTRAEPHLNLECLNDFITEMMCTLDSSDSCSEYSLNVSRDDEFYTCDFKRFNSSMCECLLQVESGFVVREIYTVNVLRRKNLMFIKHINTTDSIKPIKPVIKSVNKTQNGNFLIVLYTNYSTEHSLLSNELTVELTYYAERSKGSRKTVTLTNGMMQYELIGRNLESNSNYTVQARVLTKLNSRFSDYSDPYWFVTPSSPNDVLMIIIPIICVLLIICVISIYYSYNKILTEWWEKIPTPKIATNFVKQVPKLLSFQNDVSPVHLESSKLVQPEEKTWSTPSLVHIKGENTLNSLDKDSNSAEVIYGQTGNVSLEEDSSENITSSELAKESQLTNVRQTARSNKYFNCNKIKSDGRNGSGFSNKFYLLSGSDNFHIPPINALISDFNESQSVPKTLDPIIATDFDYSPCTLGSENTSLTQFTPTSNEITAVSGCTNKVNVCVTEDHLFVSSPNDTHLSLEKLICRQNLQNISPGNPIIHVENGYKDFQSLLHNPGENQSIIPEPELQHLYDPALAFHTSPGIQIDCSYHRV